VRRRRTACRKTWAKKAGRSRWSRPVLCVSTANALLVSACSDGEPGDLPGPSDRSVGRMLASQYSRTTEQTAVAHAVAASVPRRHCARDERAQRVNRLGRRVAAVLWRCYPGGMNGRGASREICAGSIRAQREYPAQIPSSGQRAFSSWLFSASLSRLHSGQENRELPELLAYDGTTVIAFPRSMACSSSSAIAEPRET